MTSGATAAALREIGTLFGVGTVAGMTDGQLLERFLARRDEGAELAFAALVARHGPMVLGVCRRALADPGDADDAFQATFLVLVRKARSVRVDDSLGRWLYGVSRKVAARARAVAARRPRTEAPEFEAIAADGPDPDRFEARAILDEELARLPEAYRSAVVLCDLGGLTHEEAARDLRCPVGTIKSRLARGRDRLRGRLERRGLAPSSMALAPAVPASLVEAAARSASVVVWGSTAAGVVPVSAALLAREVIQTMTGIKLKLAAAAALSIGVAATGAGVMGQSREGDAKPGVVGAPSVPEGAERRPPAVDRDRRIEARLDEPVSFQFRETPLGEVIQSLQDRTGLKFVLDPKALTENGLTRQTRFNLTVGGVRLSKALNDLLRPHRLTHLVADGAVVITSRETPEQTLADLRRERDRARKRLAAARRITRDKEDPAIARAQAEVAKLEAELARIDPPDEEAPIGDPGAAKDAPAGRARMAEPGRDPKSPPAREHAKVSMPDYVVEPPDIIIVEVLEALPGRPITGERLVRPDGKISLGFYGEVYVAGLTTTEIKAKVVLLLREFLNDDTLGLSRNNPATGNFEPVSPARTNRVFVDVTTFNSKVYYVQGEVGTPSRLPVTGNDTVLDAINYAGGLKPAAAKDRIRLVRPRAEGEESLPVDLAAIINKGDTATNYQLFPGDRLIVDRDPKAAPDDPSPAAIEARLQTVERKLDEILKALERLPKP